MGTPVWKGELAYAGRSFAAKILTGARSENISFNQLHRSDLSRVKQVLFCQAEAKAVPRDELVKGYEYAKDQFIVLQEDELKGLAPDAPAVIDLKEFFPLDQVDPLYFESSYYVVPGADGEPAYAALFGALRRTALAGLVIVCLYSRERPLLFRAGKTGIIAHALYYSHELRSLDQFRTGEEAASEFELVAAKRALKGLEGVTGGFDPLRYPDLQRLRTDALIEAKVRSKAAGQAKPVKSSGKRSKSAAKA